MTTSHPPSYDVYQNPLETRYASPEMLYTFSTSFKTITWRKLWLALAHIEKQLGIPITDEQLLALEQNIENIDFARIAQYEKKLKHDVMAHLHGFAEVAPIAKPILHLGATSAYITDNADLIITQKGLALIQIKMLNVMAALSQFALTYKDLPTLGFTHFQPAQFTTVGKRATLWLYSLFTDFEQLQQTIHQLPFRGAKGTTGTAASFKALFNGDYAKWNLLNQKLLEYFSFNTLLPVSGQTYDRKIDVSILNLLSNIAISAHKFSNDLRLLQSLQEIQEPFEQNQVGSSAMPYKQNPILSERISSLSKFTMALASSTTMVASTQWFERTLDDSANKRLSIPQAFLAVDSILMLWLKIVKNMTVNQPVILKNIMQELPFIATENLIMEAVKQGGDRQILHEIVRKHSVDVARSINQHNAPNNLIDRLLAEPAFQNLPPKEVTAFLQPSHYTGFASEQTQEFIETFIQPVLNKHSKELHLTVDLKV